jgi:hypothetical protein
VVQKLQLQMRDDDQERVECLMWIHYQTDMDSWRQKGWPH